MDPMKNTLKDYALAVFIVILYLSIPVSFYFNLPR